MGKITELDTYLGRRSSAVGLNNGMKLEISNRRKNEKNHEYIEIKQHSSQQTKDQRKNYRGNKIYPDTSKNRNISEFMGCRKSSFKREVQSNKCLH